MNLKTLKNEEEFILFEWRSGLKKLLRLQDELWRVRNRIKEVSD